MTKDTPKFIYFDLGNVLLTFNHRVACQQVGKLVGLPADRIWDLIFASQLQSRYEQGAITSRDIYGQFCQQICDDHRAWPDYRAFHVANSDIFHLNVPVIAIVAHLQSAGYPLGILSNTCEAHWKHVANDRYTVLNRMFRVTVLSYEQRSSKPERKIYEDAVARAGVEPGEIFFVDDRPENVEGACQAGLDAVLFRGPQQLAADLRGRGVRFNY